MGIFCYLIYTYIWEDDPIGRKSIARIHGCTTAILKTPRKSLLSFCAVCSKHVLQKNLKECIQVDISLKGRHQR